MKRIAIAVLISLAAVVASAQQSAAPAAGSQKMDHDACMKMDSADAQARAKDDAAWKAIQADLAAAKASTGDKKAAALEAALEKLIALHNEMWQTEHAGMAPAASHGAMDCCAGKDGAAKASMAGGMACDHEGSAAAAAPAKK